VLEKTLIRPLNEKRGAGWQAEGCTPISETADKLHCGEFLPIEAKRTRWYGYEGSLTFRNRITRASLIFRLVDRAFWIDRRQAWSVEPRISIGVTRRPVVRSEDQAPCPE